MILNAIKALLHRALPRTEEDRVIDEAKAGNCEPFIAYFRDNIIRFTHVDHHRQASPTGRIVYEDDTYSYVYIDGVWIERMEIMLPYEVRETLFCRMEDAVMSNIFGTIAYEAKHFGRKKVP